MAINFLKVRTGLTLKTSALPGTPENGDIVYDGTVFQFYQNGSWITIPTTSFNGRAGSQTVSNATTSQAITFSSTLGTTNYAISVVWRNTVDSNPQFQQIDITAKSATGFTASWNAPTDSVNYVLEFTAIPNT